MCNLRLLDGGELIALNLYCFVAFLFHSPSDRARTSMRGLVFVWVIVVSCALRVRAGSCRPQRSCSFFLAFLRSIRLFTRCLSKEHGNNARFSRQVAAPSQCRVRVEALSFSLSSFPLLCCQRSAHAHKFFALPPSRPFHFLRSFSCFLTFFACLVCSPFRSQGSARIANMGMIHPIATRCTLARLRAIQRSK